MMKKTMKRGAECGRTPNRVLRVLAWGLSALMLWSAFSSTAFSVFAEGESAAQTDVQNSAETEAPVAEPTPAENAISSVTISSDRTSISVSAELTEETAQRYSGGKLFLFELSPYQTVLNLEAFDPVADAVIDGESYSFTVPFAEDSEQMFSRYLCAVLADGGIYTVLTDERYIDNCDALADNRFTYPKAASKKGLSVQLVADAQLLGAAHTTVTVPINEYFAAAGEGSVAFEYHGTEYYINSEKLARLDHRVKTYTDAGMHVYLNIVMTAPSETQPDGIECLYKSEYASSITYYAINASDRNAVGYFAAFMTFLAGRYTAPGGEHGFAGSYIIGYEINSNRYYNNMGETEVEEYVDEYIRLLRTADTALRSVYSEARVYVSLANNFEEAGINPRIQVNRRLDYTAREILDLLGERASDIPWNLAYYPYASEYDMTEIWKDEKALSGFSTPYITMANIEVLCEYLMQKEFLYNGKSRSIAIAEFGVSADAEDEDALAKQAAAFAYAYYKAAAMDSIESMIYYRQIDNRLENGVHFGLWRYGATEEELQGGEKPIYEVFRYIDTQQSAAVSGKYLSSIDVTGWGILIPGFDESDYLSRTVVTGSAISSAQIPRSYRAYSLFNFSDMSLHGFRPTENAAQIDIREASGLTDNKGAVLRASTLYADLVSTGAYEYMGISRNFSDGLNLAGIRYLTFSIKAEAPVSSAGVKVMLRLTASGGETDGAGYTVYEGTAQVTPGQWTELCFDLSELTALHTSFDHMTVWVEDEAGNRTGEKYSFWLSGVDVYQKDMSRVTRFTLAALAIVSVILAVIFFVAMFRILSVRRRKKQRLEAEERAREKQRQTELARKREEEFRKQAMEIAIAQDSGQAQASGQQALRRRIEKTRSADGKDTKNTKNK